MRRGAGKPCVGLRKPYQVRRSVHVGRLALGETVSRNKRVPGARPRKNQLPRYVQRLNDNPIDAGLMMKMLEHVNSMPAGQRSDFSGRAIGVVRFIEEEASLGPEKARVDLLIGFNFRMEALARLSHRPEYAAWSLRVGAADGMDVISKVLVEAAARAPLIEIGERLEFDPDAFFALALSIAEAEGKA